VKPFLSFAFLILCLSAVAQDTPVSRARALAHDGKRTEALQAVEQYLQEVPEDTDARTLHGTILSWEGRYEEARAELEFVLDRYPLHGDATPVLINVELFTDHPERAAELARAAIAQGSTDPILHLFLARALNSLKQPDEAVEVLNTVLHREPGNQQARTLRESIREQARRWSASVAESYEWFNDNRAAWQETGVTLGYQAGFGSLAARFSAANRFAISSRMLEIDAYPTLRSGTYLYLNVGWSPDRALYPGHRLGAEIFQRLPMGMEMSGGLRRLGFVSPVNVYTASLSKYHGNWLFSTRSYVTPGKEGSSVSYQFSARRYFSDGNRSVGFRAGTGAAPIVHGSLNEIEVLRSSSLAADTTWRVGRRWTANLSVSHSREARLFSDKLLHHAASGSLNYRF